MELRNENGADTGRQYLKKRKKKKNRRQEKNNNWLPFCCVIHILS